MSFLDKIRYNTAEHLPQKVSLSCQYEVFILFLFNAFWYVLIGISLAVGQLVTLYFNMTVNLMSHVKNVASEENDLISFANKVLEVTEKLVFTLMEKTDNISLQNLGMEPAC